MPTYKAKSRGFYEGKLYDPEGKRRKLRTEKPFEKIPSWLEEVSEATPAEDKPLSPQQKAALTRAANKAKKDADKPDFMGETSKKSTVETLT